MTGNEIRNVRRQLQLTQAQFAKIVGTSNGSCVSRWEAAEKQHYKLNSRQEGLIQILQELLARQYVESKALGAELLLALRQRGDIFTVYRILREYYGASGANPDSQARNDIRSD